MTNEEYKQLSLKEFTKAAKNYESDHAGCLLYTSDAADE